MTQSLQWSEVTKKVFNGIVLYALAGILLGIFDPIESLVSTGDTLASLAGVQNASGGAGSFLSIFCYIFQAGLILGCILIFVGLTGFKDILDGADQKAIGKVRLAYILVLIGVAVDFIPLMGWISTILGIIAFIYMLLGYSALKSSSTFPELARGGASLLFVALILLIVGEVVDFIPFAGDILQGILNIVAYILIFVGWKKIKDA
ncbi:hypothetical protein FACS1894199_15060 [Bacteroidia bacterium]|nr:hypothetical protein FACS1894199_15060 [Bacteroidia bacterium]